MTSRRFATIFFITAAVLCIAAVMSLMLSNCISSAAGISEPLKTFLTVLNFLPPLLGICSMLVLISKRAKSNLKAK